MKYQLVKKLKDAGFPQLDQKGKLATFPNLQNPVGYYIAPDKKIGEPTLSNEMVYVPTLSELIEACGDCGFALMQEGRTSWSAFTGYATDDYTKMARGSTPEEAVANLYLALKK